jgi:hypothetical protein
MSRGGLEAVNVDKWTAQGNRTRDTRLTGVGVDWDRRRASYSGSFSDRSMGEKHSSGFKVVVDRRQSQSQSDAEVDRGDVYFCNREVA